MEHDEQGQGQGQEQEQEQGRATPAPRRTSRADPVGALLAEYGLRPQALARAMGASTKRLYHLRSGRWSWRTEDVEAAAAFLCARGVPLGDATTAPANALRTLLAEAGCLLLPPGYLRLGRGPDNPTARYRRERNMRRRAARLAPSHRTPAA